MGLESLNAAIETVNDREEVCAALLRKGFRRLDEECFLERSSEHVFEGLLLEAGNYIELSLRVALCQGACVFLDFAKLVVALSAELNGRLKIQGDVLRGAKTTFGPEEEKEALNALIASMHLTIVPWIAEFGHEPALLTCDEAIRKYVLPRAMRLG